MAKKKYPGIVTPAVVAAYAYCEEPDTHWGEANAKYKISLKLPKDTLKTDTGFIAGREATAEEIVNLILDAQKENGAKPGDVPSMRDGDLMVDKDGNPKTEMHGFWVIQANTNSKPRRIDSKRNLLPDSIPIRGGDVVKALLGPSIWENGGKTGFKIYLNEVMLVDKRSFDMIQPEEDGFVVDASMLAEAEQAADTADSGGANDGDF